MSTQTDNSESTDQFRERFHDHFGRTDTSDPENRYGDYCESPEAIAVGEDSVIMWIPDDVTLPLGIPVAEFEPAQSVSERTIVNDDNESVPIVEIHHDGNDTSRIYHGNSTVTHGVQRKYLAKIADFEGVSSATIYRRLKLHVDHANYPVLIPLERGRVLVSPYLYDE